MIITKKISELTPAVSVGPSDIFEIEQSGVSKFATAGMILAGIPVAFLTPGGRLTTESGVPVSTLDRTAQGTLYYTPFIHNNIYTYTGSAWQAKVFSEISLSLTITSGKNYDVFINSGANALSLSSAWTNDTTRADALGTQDGVTVLGSDHSKLWLGSIRASGTNVTEDSRGGTVSQVGGKRFVWNTYNQVARTILAIDTAASWTYSTATIRQAHGASGNKVEYITGFASDLIEANVIASVVSSGANTVAAAAGVGIDTTTSFTGLTGLIEAQAGVLIFPLISQYKGSPGLGYHYASWNEIGMDVASIFLGTSLGSAQSGISVLMNN
jgi:hypothetical protein